MIPVVTPSEMGEIDAAAPEPVEVLIGRAATAVAREALDMLGGAYGRRVVVVAGKGNNGNDGREAARLLRRRGVRTTVVDASDLSGELPRCHLLVDAAYGTGFRGTWDPPGTGGCPVLAVDIPSGVDGLTGVASGAPWSAQRTVTFAAPKPGLLLGDGPEHCGDVVVADIGLDVSGARTALVQDDDVAAWIPPRPRDDHKWRHAVWVVAGSPGMTGAGWLCARGAMRGGSGYVRVSSPGVDHPDTPLEAVGVPAPSDGWGAAIGADSGRFAALVVGPGLGRGSEVRRELCGLVGATEVPMVLDADALDAISDTPLPAGGPRVMTPHDGEFAALMGDEPGADRIEATRAAARRHDAVVLLKGPTTVVADPQGTVRLVTSGDERLATAGSGDVLGGLVAAHLAAGADPLDAAAAAAHLHGVAATLAGGSGVVADDIAEVLGPARDLLG